MLIRLLYLYSTTTNNKAAAVVKSNRIIFYLTDLTRVPRFKYLTVASLEATSTETLCIMKMVL